MHDRFSLALAVAGALAPSILVSAASFAQSAVRLELPSQPLDAALRHLGNQTKTNILFDPASVRNLEAPAVSNAVNVEEALAKMLVGSGLTYRFIDARTVTLIPADVSLADKTSFAMPRKNSSDRIHLAEAENPASQAEESRAGQSEDYSQPTDQGRASPQKLVGLEEIVVTGTHLRNAGDPIGSKVTVIDRNEIDAAGHGTLQDVFDNLPQNFAGNSEDSGAANASNFNRGEEVQLRGLGVGTTLTLVNGQRQPGGGTLGAFVDISSIPSAAIERIEILSDGASAIYGSDAIGGVVNIILRKDYDGAETRLRAGKSGGDADEMQLSQLFGTRWSSGSVLLGYQYSQRDPLSYGDNPRTARNGDLREFGGSDLRQTFSNPGNIIGPTGTVAFAVPSGQDGSDLTAGDLLPATTNYRDLSYVDLLPDQELHGAFANVSQAIGERLQVHADLRYGKRYMTLQTQGAIGNLLVPSTNPFYVNPFGGTGPVRVWYDFTRDLGPQVQTGEVETMTANLGGELRLGRDWRLVISAAYGEELNDWALLNRVNVTARNQALMDSNPATALNVFGDGSHTNPATLAVLRVNEFERGVATVWSANAIADGALFSLPGGAARLAVGLDYRDEEQRTSSDFTGTIRNAGGAQNDRNVYAAFAELALPLAGEDNDIPGLRKLELSLAGRYDEYSDFGSTLNPKAGVSWLPWQTLRLRGTWGRSFRAPPFHLSSTDVQLTGAFASTVPDPTSTTRQTRVLQWLGIVPDLQEETAKIWTAGLDFTPLAGLSLSLTYFDIAYRDKIEQAGATTGGLATILANDPLFAEVLVRNPTQAQVDAVCSSVPIGTLDCNQPFGAIIDNRLRNLAVVNVTGLDFNAGYVLQTEVGTFSTALSGTYTFGHERAVTDTVTPLDVVDTLGNPLAFRVRGRVSWSFHGWSTHAAVNHTGSYYNPGTLPATKIDALTTVDFGVGYEFARSARLVNGLRVSLHAANVLDEQPPFVNQFLGYDPANGSVLGRTVSVQLIKNWDGRQQ